MAPPQLLFALCLLVFSWCYHVHNPGSAREGGPKCTRDPVQHKFLTATSRVVCPVLFPVFPVFMFLVVFLCSCEGTCINEIHEAGGGG